MIVVVYTNMAEICVTEFEELSTFLDFIQGFEENEDNEILVVSNNEGISKIAEGVQIR